MISEWCHPMTSKWYQSFLLIIKHSIFIFLFGANRTEVICQQINSSELVFALHDRFTLTTNIADYKTTIRYLILRVLDTSAKCFHKCQALWHLITDRQASPKGYPSFGYTSFRKLARANPRTQQRSFTPLQPRSTHKFPIPMRYELPSVSYRDRQLILGALPLHPTNRALAPFWITPPLRQSLFWPQ